MKVAVVGGGPAGLYVALLLKKARPDADITVFERNRRDDTFGWGVVFSDQTMGNFRAADAATFTRITASLAHWDDIDVHVARSRHHVRAATASRASRARRCSHILQRRCEELGVTLRFQTDGARRGRPGAARAGRRRRRRGGRRRQQRLARRARRAVRARPRRPHGQVHLARHDPAVRRVHVLLRRERAGVFQAHCYRFDAETSTFIVECDEASWRRAGFDRLDLRADRRGLRSDCSRPGSTGTGCAPTRCRRRRRGPASCASATASWFHDGIVLIGDAAHTAHFSIGSGTKLAMEDAIALARVLAGPRPLAEALRRVPGRAHDRGAPAAERRAQLDGVVRERQALHPPGARAVRLLAADAQPAGQPREPAPARSALSRGRRAVVRRRQPRRTTTTDPPPVPMFTPFSLRDMTRRQPRGGGADGHVQRRRRHARRLPSGASRHPRARRRRSGDDRDDLRVARGANHASAAPACIAPTTSTPGAGSSTSCTVTAPPGSVCSSGMRDRRARCGCRGKAPTCRSIDGGWEPIGPSAVRYAPHAAGAAGDDPRRTWTACAPTSCGATGDGGGGRLRHARTALRARLSALEFHHAADQPPHRRVRRVAREPVALPARGLCRHARGLARRAADVGANLGHRLGRGRHQRRRRRGRRPGVRRRRRRHRARVDRTDLGRRHAGLRPHVPDAVQRPDSQRRSACRPSPSATSPSPIR